MKNSDSNLGLLQDLEKTEKEIQDESESHFVFGSVKTKEDAKAVSK